MNFSAFIALIYTLLIFNQAHNDVDKKFPAEFLNINTPSATDKFETTDRNNCDICIYVVRHLQDYMRDPEIRDQIIEYLLNGCKLLPPPKDDECASIVNNYVPAILESLLDENPRSLCMLMNIC